MREHKMTEWDAGNDLVYCADIISEREKGLRDAGYTAHADVLRKARLQIGTMFNSMGTHGFQIPEESDDKSIHDNNVQRQDR